MYISVIHISHCWADFYSDAFYISGNLCARYWTEFQTGKTTAIRDVQLSERSSGVSLGNHAYRMEKTPENASNHNSTLLYWGDWMGGGSQLSPHHTEIGFCLRQRVHFYFRSGLNWISRTSPGQKHMHNIWWIGSNLKKTGYTKINLFWVLLI